jgi:hypothetical protein
MKWEICLAFKIGFGSFFATNTSGVVWPTCDAIDASYSIGLDPNNIDELKKMAEEFSYIAPYSGEVFDKDEQFWSAILWLRANPKSILTGTFHWQL